MAAKIHPTAIIEPGAVLSEGVEIGAYAYVGPQVSLGTGTRLHHHASVEGNTVVGAACEIFPYACVGGKTQDLKYAGGNPGLRIGDRNTFREYVTIHCATNDGEFTRIGSDNVLLATCHVAHDCIVGSHVVMSNGAVLAGHVTVDDHVVIGGYGGVHQFCRVGAYAMLSAMAKLVHDLPPYFIADGTPAEIRAINRVGLERNGFSPAQLDRVRQVHRLLYRAGLNRTQALERLAAHADAGSDEFQRMLRFAQTSQRGLAPGGKG
ncbi:MAG: acyl-ACP--UDP-N-acetylglucosamine O-acyltransferase [Verrucomicrobia bacterium]|jgi:UDP-N-acetylglucosamine acyltransferase|nr:acyl-ACP--UDP-N-acetylglucosamine O-acyltransferase [Verrucomicrobiota bacterium]